MEKQDFSEAFSHFQAVIEYGGRASQNHLGWAYIECGKMNVQKGDVQTGEQYYYLGKNILKCKESENDMVNACTAYISSIFQAGYMEKGIQYTDELYEEISDVELRRKVEAWRETNVGDKKGNKRNEELSSQMASPEEIANEAQRLHESKEDREQAWALIRLASERYQQNGNMAGVGKCENNMGYFCMEEGKNAEAVTYFKKALDIKKLLNDVNGVVRQLINILAMFTRNKDMENAGKIVEYVRANLPEYEKTIEKYRLFFALAQYYMLQQNFAEAIYYGKRAEEGIEFLPEVGKAESQIVSEFVKQMESIFDDVKKENMNSNQFQVELNEAVRLYKTGKFSESCDKLETLERENKGNCMSLGIIKGTLGNACLNEKQFQKAIVHFEDAKRLFLRVKSENISESREHYFTAVNGIVLAMDGLKRREEAILILRRELKSDELTDKAKFTHVEPI